MNTKLTKLRDACTDRQVKFCQFLFAGILRPEAYKKAGYKPKDHRQAIVSASKLITTNKRVIAYFTALKDNQDRNTNISRSMQLSSLQRIKDRAIELDNLSVAVSAIREQNEMLGYHRELAPNKEREMARRDIIERELVALERLCKDRTEQLSQVKQVTSKDVTQCQENSQ